MALLTHSTTPALWQAVIKDAENSCSIHLKADVEAYLISLLIRYTNRPDALEAVLATTFLEATAMRQAERQLHLQQVGDQCLLFAGLFPHQAERKHVKISYFVNIGRTAYTAVSHQVRDLYWTLGTEFVTLMDVLQSIRHYSDLMPLEAYEQWDEVGSQRALKLLRQYTGVYPYNSIK